MLKIINLCADAGRKKILRNISLQAKKGELHVLIGPNASGKTTLSKVIMGLHQNQIKKGKIIFNGKDITGLKPEKRAKLGMALAFQHPPAIKGVKLSEFLEKISNRQDYRHYLPQHLLEREVNVKFSGGEQKFSELVQVFTLGPKLIIFDEIDSGVDIKGLEKITGMIKKWFSPEKSALVITHSGSVLEFLKPDMIHILLDGRIICSSSDWKKVWKTVKRHGYEKCKECELSAG
ncbi:ABC transporter ATP-binding protein [Candidatus Woesearchaeota archaeon]|nr:ABC transporter ATP-binding protein [Candidatus Woesearchaeota archaeon]